ncbi:sporulation protein YlmC with PRC-barrel domain [Neorhizobium galegae]|uniref:PRC-barrel domain-containing protein n=1 Tax=Neorhizobium galegae TaxID=399 RepID=UPI001AEA22F6|nr:PRC-barrel domain-containing protein [Neorhizobium galegae]MBP2548370.1 sporulation protein YlmC with PRC-barrel domain [Neorhizobium galegae]
MSRKLIAALALSTVLPFAALAQTTTTAPVTPGQTTNQNNAHGGMADSHRSTEATTAGPFVTVPGEGAWRFSDLEGKAVYGADGENIGQINDVLVSQNGSVNAVIIGVGGFLGIGEKDVAVDMSALQLGPGMSQEEANAAAAQSSAVSPETTAATQPGTTTPPAAGAARTTTDPAGTGMGAASNRTGAPGAATSNSESNGQLANADAAQIGDDGLPQRIVLNVTREQLQDAPAFEGMTPAR